MRKPQIINRYTPPAIDPVIDTVAFAAVLFSQHRTGSAQHNKRSVWPSAWARARQHRNAAQRVAT